MFVTFQRKRIVSSVQVYIGSVSCLSFCGEISDVLRRLPFFYRIEMCYQKLEHRLNFACAHVERIRFAFMSMSFRFIRIFLLFFSSILSIDRERKPKTFHVSFSFFSHKLEMLWKLIPLMVFPSRADSKRNKKRYASDRTFILSIFAFFSGSRANPSEWIKQTCISSQTENLFSIYRSNVNMDVYACD